MELALGVDGGGTRTRCIVVDERARVVGVGVSGPSKFDDVGMDTARANLHQAILQACQAAGGTAGMGAAFLGIGGVVSDRDRRTVRNLLAGVGLPAGVPVGIDHDIRIALAGATAGEPGIVLIVGTGSSCYGRNAAGEEWRSGGWGYLLDDLGSAFYLGRRALVAVVRAHDGRDPATALTGPVLRALGLRDINEVMHRVYHPRLDVTEISALAPIVVDLAASDPAARTIIDTGCAELGRMVAAVALRLGLPAPVPVVPVGGLATSGPAFSERLAEAIDRAVPGARVREPLAPPVAGAALLALEQLGITLDLAGLSQLQNLSLTADPVPSPPRSPAGAAS